MKNLSKKQIIIGGIIIILILTWFFFFKGSNQGDLSGTTVTVTKGPIAQEVSVTGRVEPTTSVNFGFEKSGRITGAYSKVGDHVGAGALLAQVESTGAQASVLESEARLAELKRGPRIEEVAVKEAEIAKLTQDLTNSYDGIQDITNDAFTKSDDALHVKTAGMFSGFKTSSYRFTYQICDSQLDLNATTLRQNTEYAFDAWRLQFEKQKSATSPAALETNLDSTYQHLLDIQKFLDATTQTLTLDCTLANSSLDTYRTNMNTARSNITTVLSTINSKRQSIASLKLTLEKAKNELALINAGSSSESIAAEEAKLFAAKGELQKYRVYAPTSGVITQMDAKNGEYANTTTPFFSIISDSSFEIKAQIPEADIAKIKTGDTARVTLDAYGSDAVFEARVVTIDPAETIIDNVPTYKVTLHFTQKDTRIKSGMTANIDIKTASKETALTLPQRAIKTTGTIKTVSVIQADGTATDTPITVGLRGSDGSIEILSGIGEGAKVLIAPK